MTLLDFVRMARHNAWVLLLCSVLGALVGAGYSFTQPTLFASTATGIVVVGNSSSVGDVGSGMTLANDKAGSYQVLVYTRTVAEATSAAMVAKYGHPVSFRLSASVTVGSPLFRVTAVANTASGARDAADLGLKATADAVNKLETMTITGSNDAPSVIRLQAYETAVENVTPISPNWKLNVPAGAVGGLIVGFAIAFVRRSVDGRIRTQSEVEQLSGAGVLGVIPNVPELEEQRTTDGSTALGNASEAFRHLRTNLRYVNVDHPPRVLVVTSANPSEGKSTIAANLARVLADSGTKTLLVDADLRRPTQHKTFDLDSSVGLTQLLAGEVAIDEVLQPSDRSNLLVIVAGRIPPNPSELLGSNRMHRLIDALRQEYTVIIDAPPLLPVTDAGLLAASTDGAILVLATGRTFKEQLRACVRILNQVNGRLLGTVLNLAPQRGIGSVIYGYGYGGYQYSNNYYRYSSNTKQAKGRRGASKPQGGKKGRSGGRATRAR